MNKLEILQKALKEKVVSPIKHCSIYGCFNTPLFKQIRSDGIVDLLCPPHTQVRLKEHYHEKEIKIHNLKIEIEKLELLIKTAIPPLIPMYQGQLRTKKLELKTLQEEK